MKTKDMQNFAGQIRRIVRNVEVAYLALCIDNNDNHMTFVGHIV